MIEYEYREGAVTKSKEAEYFQLAYINQECAFKQYEMKRMK